MIGALAITFLIANSDRGLRERRWSVLLILLLFIEYAHGTITQADALLDKSQPKTFEATVLSKHFSGGKTTTRYLQVGPWGPQPEAKEVRVSRSLYNSIFRNGIVCIHLSDGALDVPWYYVSVCR